MKNEIRIKDLECFGFHGVLEEEQKLGQKFVISAVIKTSFAKAIISDSCEDTINYAQVCHFINNIVSETKYNLIESLADYLTKKLLVEFSLINEVEIEVKKPWAPIKLNLETASVVVKRKWHTTYVAVGSNLGEKIETINKAKEMIESSEYNENVILSELIESKPYGYKEQDNFVNGAIKLKTLMEPMELLEFLQKIEQKLDRKREIHWGPRTIDLDILLYDDLVLDDPRLIIPHVDMCNRDFVLKPLCDLNPYLVHPLCNKRVAMIYEELKKSLDYEKTV